VYVCEQRDTAVDRDATFESRRRRKLLKKRKAADLKPSEMSYTRGR
jgi:hypothetical protein